MSKGSYTPTGRRELRAFVRAVPAFVLAFALCLSLGASSGHAAHAKKRKPKPPPAQTAVAKHLVATLVGAKTPAGRYKALLSVFRALHLGVVTRTGKPIVVSPEPNAARLAELYDFELRGLAQQLGRGQTTTLDDVGVALKKAGIGLDATRPLPSALLAEAMRDATRQALAHPRSGSSLLPLVVRELGLRHGYDTSKPFDPGIKLDSLQAWLTMDDISLPILRRVKLPKSRVLASGADLPSACAKYDEAVEAMEKRIEKALGGKIQQWIADEAAGKIYDKLADRLKREATRWAIKNMPRWAVRGIYNAGKAASVAGPIIDLIHGALLAYSIDVRSLEDSLPPIHWWHSAGEGTTLTFRIKVTMLDDYGDTAVKCGKLLGFELPPKGGVKDVWVNWEQAQGRLKHQGKLDCNAVPVIGACVSKTGDDGIARLVFTPKTEVLPGMGFLTEVSGVVDGLALYQTAAGGGIAGDIAQFLTPKFGSTRWFVRSHEQYVFDLSGQGTQTTTWTYHHTDQWRVPCGVNSDGSGAQTIHFATSSPVRIVFFRNSTGKWTVSRVTDPTFFGATPIPFGSTIDRHGTLTSTDASPGTPCAGGGGGPPPPPPPPDCGQKASQLIAGLTYDGAALTLGPANQQNTDPFSHCPIASSYALRLLEAGTPLAEDRLSGSDPIALAGSASYPHEEHTTTTLTVGTSTTDATENTSVDWTLSLDPDDP